MQIAIVGLGRMGMNMARRLILKKHDVYVYNRTSAKSDELASEGAVACYTLEEIAAELSTPRVIWLMLPAGEIVDQHIEELATHLSSGDVIIEGGNSYFKDDIRRSEMLNGTGIHYLDAGVSGGIWGLEIGYCLMVGGSREIFDHVEPVLKDLAPEDGYLYCGPSGAGHFVKMIHNGIEYGMMQAYGEGFALLEASPYAGSFDYGRIAHLWNQGSVVRSWLLELLEDAFREDPRLQQIKGYVDDSGEGRWTVMQAIETAVAAPVITQALFSRFQSRKENLFENRVLAALRKEFGGHAVKKSGNNRQ